MSRGPCPTSSIIRRPLTLPLTQFQKSHIPLDNPLHPLESSMKFTDGLWHRPYGHEFSGGVEVVDILNDGAKNGELEYLVATRHVAGRGDTLNGKSPFKVRGRPS